MEAATNLENWLYTDENDDTATIPAGFAVSQVEGENTIADGLVVIDQNGNEFVWVPVTNFNNFIRHDFLNNIDDKYFNATSPTSGMYSEQQGNGESVDITSNNSVREAQEMYISVNKNNGFYIGRYETGTLNVRTENSTLTDKVLIRKNLYPYNYIGWSNSDDMENDQGGVVQLSREFAFQNNYSTVKSTLCYGVQWDAILRWMNNDTNTSEYVTNPVGKGWYLENYTVGNPEHKTGISIDSNISNCVKNIYDMAGNLAEWTMEAYSTNRRIFRGGSYNMESSTRPTAYRVIGVPSEKKEILGFRIALYL